MLGNKHSNSTLDVFQVAKKPVKDTVWQELLFIMATERPSASRQVTNSK